MADTMRLREMREGEWRHRHMVTGKMKKCGIVSCPHTPDNSREGKHVSKDVRQVAYGKHHDRLQNCIDIMLIANDKI